jgi:hypothetical protein
MSGDRDTRGGTHLVACLRRAPYPATTALGVTGDPRTASRGVIGWSPVANARRIALTRVRVAVVASHDRRTRQSNPGHGGADKQQTHLRILPFLRRSHCCRVSNGARRHNDPTGHLVRRKQCRNCVKTEPRGPTRFVSKLSRASEAMSGRATQANFESTARRTASASLLTPSRSIIRARCTSTVRTLSPRSKAIALFERPAVRA